MDLAQIPKNIVTYFREFNWAKIHTKMMRFLNKVLYFLVVVVFFQSIGVIIPIAVDFFQSGKVNVSSNVVSFNILTYSASIFLASLVKRILVFVDDDKYKHKKLEVLVLIIVTIFESLLIFGAYYNIYHQCYEAAIKYSIIIMILAWVMWWIASQKDSITDPYSAIGGKFEEA